jgi:hypothetical protein
MTYSISCVLLIPSEHLKAINALAASLGYGPDNLSVSLVKSDGSAWFGCHIWCNHSFIDQMTDPQYASDALSTLIVSAIESGEPLDNWAKTLADNDLTVLGDGYPK